VSDIFIIEFMYNRKTIERKFDFLNKAITNIKYMQYFLLDNCLTINQPYFQYFQREYIVNHSRR